MTTAIELIQREVYSPNVRTTFAASLSDDAIVFEKEAGFAMQALQNNEYLCKIALANRQSLANAITNIAAIGISLNPAKKQAYLVPRDGKICLDISYIGLMDLAMATGAILWGQALIVHEKDEFQLVALDEKPNHKFNPFAKDDERGPVVGVYVVVKTHHGDYLTHTMSIDAVNAIRDRSSAWKAWVEKKKSCPWVTDKDEMGKKTCVKQAQKYWPRNARLDTAIHHLNTDGGEGLAEIDMGAAAREQVDADAAVLLINSLDTVEAVKTEWQGFAARCAALRDKVSHGIIKAAVVARCEALAAPKTQEDAA